MVRIAILILYRASPNLFAGVDVYLNGHAHLYERTVPMLAGGVIDPAGLNSPSGILYITNGAAGYEHHFPIIAVTRAPFARIAGSAANA
jgi:hypothetical protein